MKEGDREPYIVRNSPELCERLEFEIDNIATDPSFCGPIEIQCNPQKIGVRFAGETEWSYFDWYELLVFARHPNMTAREAIEELRTAAYEEGMREGINEVFAQAGEKPKVLDIASRKREAK